MYTAVVPKLIPFKRDKFGPAKQRAVNLAAWRTHVHALLDADRCTFFLHNPFNGSLVTFVDEFDLDGVELGLDTPPAEPGGFAVQCANELRCLLYTSPSPRDAHES
eukprot:6468268-Prymnesium_polylepis.1